MSRELYPALSGAFGAWRQLEVVANNIANAETTGFKAELLVYESIGDGDAYVRISDGMIDQTTGAPMTTHDPLHVALQGPGYLVLDAGGDAPWLTRDGQLHVDPTDGTLRTSGDHVVQGVDGALVVPPGQTARIEADGTVMAGDDEVGRLRVVTADAEPIGGNLLRARGPLVDREPVLVTGALEQSNVDPMRAMVDLIAASRTFEMVQKVLETSDQLDARLNELARV